MARYWRIASQRRGCRVALRGLLRLPVQASCGSWATWATVSEAISKRLRPARPRRRAISSRRASSRQGASWQASIRSV